MLFILAMLFGEYIVLLIAGCQTGKYGRVIPKITLKK
jgi:hypothetical protein